MTTPLTRLYDEFGQSPWYDNLTRDLVLDGGLAALVGDGIRGVTSNPTIFDKAMGAGNRYDDQVLECLRKGLSIEDTYWQLVVDDITGACDILHPVYDAADGGDGLVSLEVSPELAHDTEATCRDAVDLYKRVGRPNVMIKIPATLEGLPAITRTIAAGINVNITLIFSLARHDAVIDAYVDGLEQLDAAGGDVSRIASVASFFVSRVDTEVDKRLPPGHPLRGKAAVANARLAYQLFRRRFAGERWDALAAKGAKLQRPLWASTSTKNPDYSPTLYVDELVGPDTVNTLAPPSIEALKENSGAGLRANSIAGDPEGAAAVIRDLAAAGVDFDDVTATLEREGVESFANSYRDALATLERRTRELAA
jgi:transaldolase